ncbi:MAG: biopolymer transporter ExbD [Pseudomonadota bacterium]
MKRKRTRPNDEADVNVTPLLDIVFIMLIFFIVTATFVREVGIDLARPSDDDQEDEQESTAKAMVISISAEDRIVVNGVREIDRRAVRANVERFLAEEPQGGVIISAAPEAATGLAVEVLDQAKEAGAANVSISIEAAQAAG